METWSVYRDHKPLLEHLKEALEKEGFVLRSRDRADERIVNVSLSEKGKETILKIEKDLQRLYAENLAQVDQEDLRNMIMGLEQFNQLVQKMLYTRRQSEEEG